jgi:hypothetical protein
VIVSGDHIRGSYLVMTGKREIAKHPRQDWRHPYTDTDRACPVTQETDFHD